jgi:NAD(P)-dependent dehydrogenase (short-subunit alcohol dehydrogenase family)
VKVALVTGAAGDIGRAICSALLASGLRVAGLDIDATRLRSAADEFAARDRERFLAVQADVTQMRSVVSAVGQVNQALGDVAILVNNAGGISAPSLLKTEEQHWVRDIELNLNGPWRCIRALQEQLIRTATPDSPSVIVNIASVNGLGVYGHPGYSAAKAGLIHLTRFCAVELGKHAVRSVAICPGSVKTQAWEQRRRDNPQILEEVASWYPSRDTCTPADVAKLVAYAAVGGASSMNGAVITLDGGLSSGSDRLASLFAGETL